MKRITLAALLLATPALAVLPFHHQGPPPLPVDVTLDVACKSGWIQHLARSDGLTRYIPRQYVAQVTSDAAVGAIMRLLSKDGTPIVTVRRGQSVSFDCFDYDGTDTI